MSNWLIERIAEIGSVRVRVFVRAKDAYMSFTTEMSDRFKGIRFDQIPEEVYQLARKDKRIETAMQGFIAAINISRSKNKNPDAATAMYQLGLVYHVRGEFIVAEYWLQLAVEIFESLVNSNQSEYISDCYYQLGVIALKQGRPKEAIQKLKRARILDENNSDESRMRLCDFALDACVKADNSTNENTGIEYQQPGHELPVFTTDETEVEINDEPEIEKKEPVIYREREVILVVSYSVEANDKAMELLKTMGNDFGRPVGVVRIAFGSNDPEQRQLPAPDPDQFLCAVILILEKAGLQNEMFVKFAKDCTKQFAFADNFRMLMYRHEMTHEEYDTICKSESLAQEFRKAIGDTTHVSSSFDFANLRQALMSHLRQAEYVRKSAQWKKFKPVLAIFSGKLASFIISLAVLFSLLGYPAWLFNMNMDWLGSGAPQLSSFILGLLSFPMQAPVIFMLLRGLDTSALLMPEDKAVLSGRIFFGLFVMVGATQLVNNSGYLYFWGLAGLAAGIVLEVIRREERDARSQMIDMSALVKSATSEKWKDPKTTVLQNESSKPFYCPVLPPLQSRVFISYASKSPIGSPLATLLYKMLKLAGALPFLDRFDIPVGAGFPQHLADRLTQCDVFICILDEESIRYEHYWVGAELLAVLQRRQQTGVPEIIILMDPAILYSANMLPIFEGIIKVSTLPNHPARTQIMKINDQTVSAVVRALKPGSFETASVFTRITAFPIYLVMLILELVGQFALLIGLILGFIVMLEKMAEFPFTSSLAKSGWLVPATLLIAFWFGLTARSTIAWEYERKHDRTMGITIPLIGTAGLFYTLFLLIPILSGIVITWVVILAIAGWQLAAIGKDVWEKKKIKSKHRPPMA